MKEIFYEWGGINVWLFHVINNFRSDTLDQFMLLGTALGEHTQFPLYIGLVSLVALLAVARTPLQGADHQLTCRRWMSVMAIFCIAYSLDGLFLGVLKPLLDFPRPPLALPAQTLHIIGIAQYHHSLPSGHSSFAMLCVASLWPVLARSARVAGIFFVLWVGISRVSLGAHFPADVVAGFLSSLAIVLLVSATVQRLMRRSALKPGS